MSTNQPKLTIETQKAIHQAAFIKAARSVYKKYEAALLDVKTRFEILDADLEYRFNRNPIHHIETRIKKPESVYEKLQKYGKPTTLSSMEENVLDIAGMRIIVSYIDDVYALVESLKVQDDMEIIKIKDYIKNPKPNGYRSLHIIVKTPIYFLDKKVFVPVEIQFRTIAMDFWASLEHTLRYKSKYLVEGIDMADELKNCSDIIEDVEHRMQILMRAVEHGDLKESAKRRRAQIMEYTTADELLEAGSRTIKAAEEKRNLSAENEKKIPLFTQA